MQTKWLEKVAFGERERVTVEMAHNEKGYFNLVNSSSLAKN